MTDLARNVRTWLSSSALPLWTEAGFDPSLGLFHERLSDDGMPDREAPRRVRVQARQIYVYSHAHLLGLYTDGLDLAERSFETLCASARQADGGGFVHLLSADGRILNHTFDAYDHAFAIFAMAWLFRAGKSEKVKATLLETVGALDAKLAEAGDGSYREDLDNTLPRRQNPHMHLLEAFLACYCATGDAQFLKRADNLVALFRRFFFQNDAQNLIEFFDANWAPAGGELGQIVEPGHHYEWTWLLLEHAKLSQSIPSEIEALFQFAAAHGHDPVSGLVYDEVRTDGTVKKASKRCWPQTELIKAQIAMVETGLRKDEGQIEDSVQRLFDYYLTGVVAGGWCDNRDADNQPVAGPMPASTFYHVFCALAEYLRFRAR